MFREGTSECQSVEIGTVWNVCQVEQEDDDGDELVDSSGEEEVGGEVEEENRQD